ncbi:MAG: DEAD/DEAH box helicase family protein [Nanoarchaeota archaeon]|nr:DEAD/DEAH box helicase family protein [Nanoarchaeota archaeon]
MNLREYQRKILERAREKNTLVVLPTGTGKTLIALKLGLEKKGKVLFLAPTKPLVEQHRRSLEKWFGVEGITLTGEVRPKERKRLWEENRFIFATPQTIRNDLMKGRISLDEVSLIIFDEAHRAVGDYAYVYIGRRYRGHVIALTASPGDEEKLREICKNLNIEHIEWRSEEDEDVKPYLMGKEVVMIKVELPEKLKEARDSLKDCLNRLLDKLKESGYMKGRVRKRDLLELQKRTKKPMVLSLVASAIKAWHAKDLLEMYGKSSFMRFVQNLRRDGKLASKRLLGMDCFRKVIGMEVEEHPKLGALKLICSRERGNMIIFTQYKHTADMLKEFLKDAEIFVGQSRMKQKEQIETLRRFERGEFRTLIATSIGEEGLHIPDVDVAVFFEPVPSALRMIQRKGRVGRTKFGKIYILVTKGTSDEVYYWTSRRKERKMMKGLKTIEEELKKGKKQKKLWEFYAEDA